MPHRFPIIPALGDRVWSFEGYLNHGPQEGPKINIAPRMGGEVVAIEPRSMFDSDHLWTVKWDNGQLSRHYPNELTSIGRFATYDKFVAAIKITGPIELTVGPANGFREVKVTLEYDGQIAVAEVKDKYFKDVWTHVLEPLAKKHGAVITTIKLPRKKPANKR